MTALLVCIRRRRTLLNSSFVNVDRLRTRGQPLLRIHPARRGPRHRRSRNGARLNERESLMPHSTTAWPRVRSSPLASGAVQPGRRNVNRFTPQQQSTWRRRLYDVRSSSLSRPPPESAHPPLSPPCAATTSRFD